MSNSKVNWLLLFLSEYVSSFGALPCVILQKVKQNDYFQLCKTVSAIR